MKPLMATEKKKKKKTEQPAPTYQLFSFVKASREKRQMVEKKKTKDVSLYQRKNEERLRLIPKLNFQNDYYNQIKKNFLSTKLFLN